jgi:glycosyltransferase involved in cell wall biosynthesis
MSDKPLLSYIVLSYNYERYIDKTIRSILNQTIQDFEIVVVDDCSRDNSVNVVRSFRDPRIRVIQNERNLGGAGSYNRAVSACKGEWMVNLDADDWIAPHKAERQLALAAANPRVDIIGTYISVYDQDGCPHPNADALEEAVNRPHEFGRVDTWIGANHLCRSSTMVRSAAHHRIGLDDANMVRAPDYELWTRALREGCGFALIPEKLTFVRATSSGVTHADPLGSLLEIAYATLRNLIPLAEKRALHPSIARMIGWVAHHEQLSRLTPTERYRLLGMLMQSTSVGDYESFRALLRNTEERPELVTVGRRCMALLDKGTPLYQELSKLNKDVEAYIGARDHWRSECEKWQRAYLEATGQSV